MPTLSKSLIPCVNAKCRWHPLQRFNGSFTHLTIRTSPHISYAAFNSRSNSCPSQWILKKSSTRYIHDERRPNLMNITKANHTCIVNRPNTSPSLMQHERHWLPSIHIHNQTAKSLPNTSSNTNDLSTSNLTVIPTTFPRKHLTTRSVSITATICLHQTLEEVF